MKLIFWALILPFSAVIQSPKSPDLHPPTPTSKYILVHNLEYNSLGAHVKVVPLGVSANYLYYLVWKAWIKWYGMWKIMNRFIHIYTRTIFTVLSLLFFLWTAFLFLFLLYSPFSFSSFCLKKSSLKIKCNNLMWYQENICDNLLILSFSFFLWEIHVSTKIRINSSLGLENWNMEKFICLKIHDNREIQIL